MHTLYGVIRMKREKSSATLSYALIFGAGLVLCAMAVRFWWGSPNTGITQLGIREVLPPVWLISLLWTLWYFVLGATLGCMICSYGNRCIGAWRGAFFFLLMICVGFLWYPLFFVRLNLMLSLLVIVVTAVLAGVCALQWQGISPVAGAVLWLHVLWLLYMLILQTICLFRV